MIANVFLHYGLDMWLTREFPSVTFERFADDAVIHCVTERQVREAVGRRFADIGLEVHPDKTRIVYCKDSKRRQEFDQVSFTFCGYAFRPREAFDKKRQESYTFPAAGGPGETDRREPPGSVLAAASTHQRHLG